MRTPSFWAHCLTPTIAWLNWRETTEVMCDRDIPTNMKDKEHNTARTPAMMYGDNFGQLLGRGEEIAHN